METRETPASCPATKISRQLSMTRNSSGRRLESASEITVKHGIKKTPWEKIIQGEKKDSFILLHHRIPPAGIISAKKEFPNEKEFSSPGYGMLKNDQLLQTCKVPQRICFSFTCPRPADLRQLGTRKQTGTTNCSCGTCSHSSQWPAVQANPAMQPSSSYHSCHRPTAGLTSLVPQGLEFSDISFLSPSFSLPYIPLESRNCIKSPLRLLFLLKCKMPHIWHPQLCMYLEIAFPAGQLHSPVWHLSLASAVVHTPRRRVCGHRRAHWYQEPWELLGSLEKTFFTTTRLSLSAHL